MFQVSQIPYIPLFFFFNWINKIKTKKSSPTHPAELLLKCMIQFLQVHQGAGLGAAIHNVFILDAQQVTLGDHDIDVPH